MRSISPTLLKIYLITLLVCSALSQVDGCEWHKPTYNNKDYIRVIRRSGNQYPVNYLCWKRDQISGSIFYNVKDCLIAVSDEGGIDCYQCVEGKIPKVGACVDKPKPDDKK